MAQKHYTNVREWPETVSVAAKARINANVTDKSSPAAKLYWWITEKDGTPEACAAFCNTLVAGSLKRGREAFEAATTEVAPAPAPKPADN